MAKGISGDALIPAKRTERANITRYLHRGVDIGVMKLSGSFGDAQTAIASHARQMQFLLSQSELTSSVARNRFFISRD